MMQVIYIIFALIGLILPIPVVSVSLTDFLATSGGVKVVGAAGSKTGTAVSLIGDYNKDGKQDFAISAPLMTVNSKSGCGMVLIVLGKDGAWSEIDMASAASGLTMQRVIGAAADDNAGTSVGPAGDVNGDGVDDVLIGAPNADANSFTNAGLFYMLFGKAKTATAAYADINLASFTTSASTGFSIAGPGNYYNLGSVFINIRPLGDLNGDKVDDFVVTARSGRDPSAGAGAAWILYGKKTIFSNINLASLGNAGVYLTGAGNSHYFGASVDGVGDFNGDGLNDVVIGEYQHTSSSLSYRGAVYLLYGSSSMTNIAMASFVTGPLGIRFLGIAAFDYAGYAVSGAGDINGDGKMDLLIGAYGGRIYVIYGTSTQMSADVDLSTILAANLGFTIIGTTTSDRLGLAVSRGGDLDQDGYDDFVVTSKTLVIVLYGSATKPNSNVVLNTYKGKMVSFTGVTAVSLGSGVDVTGDGIPDLVVGDPAATSNAGTAYMVKGPIYPPTPAPTKAPTCSPSKAPSRVPTLRPSAEPSMEPSSGPSVSPSVEPSAPSVVPSEAPSANPSVAPSAPSAMPSVAPSADPSASPSEAPSVAPSVHPSATPSMEPSSGPSASPSVEPSAPSVMPSEAPSADPSVSPSALPSTLPSVSPTGTPSEAPSESPSAGPSALPSMLPSAAPSAMPSVMLTADPSGSPTVAPSRYPTNIPTYSPTCAPTVRPTAEPQQVVLDIQQDIYFVNKADYDAQKVQCNKTIQHTVAEGMDGVTPERVTDIVVEEEEEEGGRSAAGNIRRAAVARGVSLKYKVTVYDPLLSAAMLTAQLKEKVRSGDMDVAFRTFALRFNATSMVNGTFGEPLVTNLDSDTTSFNDPPTDSELAGLVIGSVVFVTLLTVGVWLLVSWLRKSASEVSQSNEENGAGMVVF